MRRALSALLGLLLRTHPEASRREYADEIVQTVVDRVVEAHRTRGLVAAVELLVTEVLGVLSSSIARRRRHRARTVRPRKRERTSMEPLFPNLRLTLRGLLREPAFTLVAVLALSLGIGSAVAIFTVFHAVLLRPLPFRDPGRLVALWEKNPERGWHQAQVAPANFLDWREEARDFADMAAHYDWLDELVLVRGGEPSIVNGTEVTGNFFDVLGVAPALGRGFEESHTWAGPEPAVVFSHSFWMSRFGGDVSVLDRTLELDGIHRRVVGVMPPGFAYPFAGVDVWLPTAWAPEFRDRVFFRRSHDLRVVGRLGPGISIEDAEAELGAIAARLEVDYPETNSLMGNGLTPLRSWIAGDAARPLRVLLAAVGVLLLIAGANVSNMLLARGAARRAEVQIRNALGGSRRRLVLEGLAESLLLAGIGGGLGLVLAAVVLRPLLDLIPEGLPRAGEIGVDSTVVLFALSVSLLTGLLFGALPAWRAASEAGFSVGARASRRASRATHFIIAAEVALTLPLVIAAGLMVRTLSQLASVEPGFAAENVLVARISLPSSRYGDETSISSFYRELIDSVRAVPGVTSAAMSSRLPFGNPRWSSDFTAEGWPSDRYGIDARHDEATPGLFRTLGVPLLRGRDFDGGDDLDSPLVVIVNEALAEKYFPGEDPLGKRVCFDRVPDTSSRWRTIVGVVGNVRRDSLALEEAPSFYAPVLQDVTRGIHLLVRSEADPTTLAAAVRERVRALDPTVPFFEVTTLEDVVVASLARERFLLSLLGAAALIALVLASVGIFGVVFHATTRRVREIGIRVALGARTGSVVALVVQSGMRPVVAGLAAGIVAAAFAVRALSSFLFGVEPLDPLTFAAVVGLVLAAALVACAVPARWAARLEAVSALRAE